MFLIVERIVPLLAEFIYEFNCEAYNSEEKFESYYNKLILVIMLFCLKIHFKYKE